jgi:PAS domain S-box-containing protein
MNVRHSWRADDGSADAAWSWNLTTNQMSATRAYYRLTGISNPDEAKPFHIVPLIAREDRERVLEALFRTIAGDRTPAVPFRLNRADGTSRTVRGSARLERDANGTPLVVRGLLRDITALADGEAQAYFEPRPTDSQIAVLVVGNDRLARIGIASLLSRHRDIRVADESSLHDMLAKMPDTGPRLSVLHRFDAVVLDVGESGDGFAAFAVQVQQQVPQVKIIAVIRPESLNAVAELARCGVERMVTADAPGEMLAEAVAGLFLPTSLPLYAVPERRGGGRAPALCPATGRLSGLSEVQIQVVRLLAAGLKNREIAAELFVSEPTVKRYTQQIYRKLGARDRAHAAAIANRLGIL